MCNASRFIVAAIAIVTLLSLNNTAHAGEPLHPIFQPVFNFFRFFGF